jgi:hypothetical protein
MYHFLVLMSDNMRLILLNKVWESIVAYDQDRFLRTR